MFNDVLERFANMFDASTNFFDGKITLLEQNTSGLNRIVLDLYLVGLGFVEL